MTSGQRWRIRLGGLAVFVLAPLWTGRFERQDVGVKPEGNTERK